MRLARFSNCHAEHVRYAQCKLREASHLILHGPLRFAQGDKGALVVFLFAFLEWPLASLYLIDVPVEYMRRLEFQDVLRLYPLTQLARWLVAGTLTLLVIVGAPLVGMILVPVPTIALGCYLVLKLTEDWFAVRNPDALVGLLVTVLVQFMLYALFVAMLAR